MKLLLITVIICTYRRLDRLILSLNSLEHQTYNGFDWEVLVVENDIASTSAMNAVIENYKHKLPIRHILEPQVGLSKARNTGAHLANGEYLAYLDDDAEVAEDWLVTLTEACRSYIPDFCGGPSLPLYLSPKPDWYLDKYATSYVYGDVIQFLKTGEWLGGMNFIVLKKLCSELGCFRTDLGMNGDKVAYGEETDLMIRAWKYNPQLKVLYHPKIAVRHEVRPEKMTLYWNIKAALAGGRSFSLLSSISRKEAVFELLRNVKKMTLLVSDAVKMRYHKQEEPLLWQQWIYEVFCPWLWNVSRNYHAFIQSQK